MSAEMRDAGYRIGEVAKIAGVHVETVRFYERQGIIHQPVKPPTGIRRYSLESIDRIRFVKHAQALGFTLQEARDLLALRTRASGSCERVQVQATRKLQLVQEKLAALQRLEKTLTSFLEECGRPGRPTTEECPVLQALGGEEDDGAGPLHVRGRSL
ncbi:MerR family transcriptional regulator [Acidithiobacillus caldus]|jgi:MerR family mercuric resistance operon transcriptional regulator|nr:MerR family transcriptional regulator [Acidithiobacillus caldus]WMT47248.1 MAG: MerR family transcriptional regulator [Acidithiobacillus caldus]